MNLSCINLEVNYETRNLIDNLKYQLTGLDDVQKVYVDSLIDFLYRLTEVDSKHFQMNQIKVALTHLARSRRYISMLGSDQKLKEVDYLFEEILNKISKDMIYLIDNYEGLEQ